MRVINEYRHRDDSGNKILPFGEPSVRFCRGWFWTIHWNIGSKGVKFGNMQNWWMLDVPGSVCITRRYFYKDILNF